MLRKYFGIHSGGSNSFWEVYIKNKDHTDENHCIRRHYAHVTVKIPYILVVVWLCLIFVSIVCKVRIKDIHSPAYGRCGTVYFSISCQHDLQNRSYRGIIRTGLLHKNENNGWLQLEKRICSKIITWKVNVGSDFIVLSENICIPFWICTMSHYGKSYFLPVKST